jgi:hypothetical protein
MGAGPMLIQEALPGGGGPLPFVFDLGEEISDNSEEILLI